MRSGATGISQAELLGEELAVQPATRDPFAVGRVTALRDGLATVVGIYAQPVAIGRKQWSTIFATQASAAVGRRVLVAFYDNQLLLVSTMED